MHTTDEGSIVVRRTKTLNGSIFQLARRQLSRANDTQIFSVVEKTARLKVIDLWKWQWIFAASSEILRTFAQ